MKSMLPAVPTVPLVYPEKFLASVSCVWYDKQEERIETCPPSALEPVQGLYSSTCVLPNQGNMLGSLKVTCSSYNANREVINEASKDFTDVMNTSGGVPPELNGEPGNDDHPPSPGPPPGGGPGIDPGLRPLDEDDYVPDPGPGPHTWDDDFQPTLPPGDTPGELPHPAPIPDPGPWVFDDDGPTYPPQVMPGRGPVDQCSLMIFLMQARFGAPIEPGGDDDTVTGPPTPAPTTAGTATLTFEVTLSDVSKEDWDKDTVNSETAFGLTTVAVIAAGEQVTLENIASYNVKALSDANGVSRVAVTCTINADANPHDGGEDLTNGTRDLPVTLMEGARTFMAEYFHGNCKTKLV